MVEAYFAFKIIIFTATGELTGFYGVTLEEETCQTQFDKTRKLLLDNGYRIRVVQECHKRRK